MQLRQDCDAIVREAIAQVQPTAAVRRALEGKRFGSGRLILVSVGKAAWSMAKAAWDHLEPKPDAGVVITKYGHSAGAIGGLEIHEGAHPVPDERGFSATRRALELTEDLTREDTVLFLLSGGGSALFEWPLVSGGALQSITEQLLACGADIVEINTLRKRLSAVKGGRFARHCAPARVFAVVLSDIVGDPLDMIASGPACLDRSTCDQAMAIVEKYRLDFSAQVRQLLCQETPKELDNVETQISGSVRELCRAATEACKRLGYAPQILTDSLTCQAREAGSFLSALARYHQNTERSLAFLAGGETVVRLIGGGKGGRNQEIALAAAEGIAGLRQTAAFSFGSDGTDGPTDAAGGFVTGDTRAQLLARGVAIHQALEDNNSYPALAACGGLIVTGPTGTNVNDVAAVLIRR